jgi:hypothetical protein
MERKVGGAMYGVVRRGAFDGQYGRSSVYGLNLFLESFTQAENSLD